MQRSMGKTENWKEGGIMVAERRGKIVICCVVGPGGEPQPVSIGFGNRSLLKGVSREWWGQKRE